MTDEASQTCRPPIEITDDDLRAALREVGTYVDISIDDLKALCSSAARHAEERMYRRISVDSVMTRRVVTIGEEADIHGVARLLSEHGISGAPVVDGKGRVIGMITEADVLAMTGMGKGHTVRDLIRHLLGEPIPGRPIDGTVADVMSSPVISVHPETDIREAARILSEKRIKRVPVVDHDGRLVGIVSRTDVIRITGHL
jgi:CBS domain-containing membrane protein